MTTGYVASERPDFFRAFFEGDVVGILIVVLIGIAMLTFWIWRDRRQG